ncbi:MAG: sulfotransferase [Gammaproteobacteria bacterium]|nr:MAG: sulfotransferase [Gammaproteobacteria bacterium]
MSRPKVALTAGAAHGGTTIANMILGQHPEIFATGKLRDFPDGDVFSEDKVCAPGDRSCWECSCGELAMHCPFWLEVRERYARLADWPIDKRLPELFRMITELSGRPFVGDVTHNVGYARQLMEISGIDLYLIHVVRDGRGVVNSRLRKDYNMGLLQKTGWRHTRRVIKLSRRWLRQHHALAALEKQLGPKAVRISHEDLCINPRATLQPVGECLGLDFDSIGAALGAGEPFGPVPHLIRGNANLRLGKEVVLKYEPSNLARMSGLDQAIFGLASKLPVFGY